MTTMKRVVSSVLLGAVAAATAHGQARPFSVVEANIVDMRTALQQKRTTSHDLVLQSLARIALYEDRLHAVLLRGIEEVHRTINISVIGDRNRFLADARYALNQLFNVARTVQQGVVGVQVQVSKFRHGVLLLF